MRFNPTDERRRRLSRSSGDPDRALYEFNRINGLSTITAADWPFHQDRHLITRMSNGSMGRIKAMPAQYIESLADSKIQDDTRVGAVRATQIPGLDDTLLIEVFFSLVGGGHGSRVSRQAFGGRWVTQSIYPVVAIYFPVSVKVTNNKGFGKIAAKTWVGRTGGRKTKAAQFRDEGAKYAAWNYIEAHARPGKFGHAYMKWLGYETICGAVRTALPPREPIIRSYEHIVEVSEPMFPVVGGQRQVPPEILQADEGFRNYRALAQAYQAWRTRGSWNPVLFSSVEDTGLYAVAPGGDTSLLPKAHEDGCRFPWPFINWAKETFDLAFLGVPHQQTSRDFLAEQIELGRALTYNPRV